MKDIISENYLIYKVKNKDLYAAVGQLYQRDIRQCAAEYQCLSLVPSDRVIKAILIAVVNEHLYELKYEREVYIQINSLEFDTGNFRLSA